MNRFSVDQVLCLLEDNSENEQDSSDKNELEHCMSEQITELNNNYTDDTIHNSEIEQNNPNKNECCMSEGISEISINTDYLMNDTTLYENKDIFDSVFQGTTCDIDKTDFISNDEETLIATKLNRVTNNMENNMEISESGYVKIEIYDGNALSPLCLEQLEKDGDIVLDVNNLGQIDSEMDEKSEEVFYDGNNNEVTKSIMNEVDMVEKEPLDLRINN